MRRLCVLTTLCAIFLWNGSAFAQQGQWGGFIYLIPKDGIALSAEKRESVAKTLEKEISCFSNDYTPEKGQLETVLFCKGVEYSLDGKPLSSRVPTGLIRVESLTRAKIDKFHKSLYLALNDYFDIEYRISVTRELMYTDAATLGRLKTNAPTRGNGKDQPNAVILPLTKTTAWWAMPLDKRKQYFDKSPETLGKAQMGHNEVGFMYIKSIFRKLYHSRFIDDGQDFMTHFEFSDSDIDAFKALMNGLRDKETNPEWGFVQEKPMFWGKRVISLAEIL